MEKSSTYCVLPHLGMALQNHADVCVCNLNKASWQDRNRQVMHVHTHPIKLAFQSHTRKMIATSLDHGIRHDSCQVCWNLEDTGGKSTRQTVNQRFGHVEPLPDQPRILIIKPGNTRNVDLARAPFGTRRYTCHFHSRRQGPLPVCQL